MKKVILILIALFLFADPPWTTDVPVSQDPGGGNQNETTIGIFADSLVCGGWNDSRLGAYHVSFAASTDYGATWQETLMFEPSYPSDCDPCIVVNDSGTICYVWLSYNASTMRGDVYVTKSADWGRTWGPSICVTPNTPTTLDDKPWGACDGNNMYVTWRAFYGATGIRFKRSTDWGQTWGSDVVANTGTFIGDYNAIAADRLNIYGLWCDCRSGSSNPDVFSSRRTNDIAIRERKSVSSPKPGLILSFPNPFTNRSTIRILPEDANLHIYQADGRRVEKLDAVGVYFLVLEKGNHSITKKLVKIE